MTTGRGGVPAMRGLDIAVRLRDVRCTRWIGSLVRGNHCDAFSWLDSSFNQCVCKVLNPLSPEYYVRRVVRPSTSTLNRTRQRRYKSQVKVRWGERAQSCWDR